MISMFDKGFAACRCVGRGRGLPRVASLLGWISLWTPSGWGQSSPIDYAVLVTAAVQSVPPSIVLSWPNDPAATGYQLCRKSRDASSWGPVLVSLGPAETSFADTNVVVGAAYEYAVTKLAPNYTGYGYIYAGIQVPLVDQRGTVIFVVENTITSALASELARLQQDLVGDGWQVVRHDVPRMSVDPANTNLDVGTARSNELASLKALIQADYAADPLNVRTVFLLGHVPVPYSGNLSPDEHADHVGAWPADLYYGDMYGAWTDATVTSIVPDQDPRNRNVPGDGKFDPSDQTSMPLGVTLEVGRVDLSNLPACPQSETELLFLYLNKDHAFRNKTVLVDSSALIDDQFGLLPVTLEAPAVNGWRNFAACVGPSNIVAGDWLGSLAVRSFLWGYGCGAGTYTGAAGVATTSQLATNDTRVVFTMLFGSYFGDWDTTNNLMRAQLATSSYTLASAWACRPNWYFHHLALGETLGFAARLTQNNLPLYDPGAFPQFVHIALLGDPTLRLHPVAPPSGLLLATNLSGGIDLRWTSSPGSVAGYRLYWAPTLAGPFTNLCNSTLSTTQYTDPKANLGVYMLRAVKLETTPGGSYYNLSQGVFQSLADNHGSPHLNLSLVDTNTLALQGDEVLGRVYRIQVTQDLLLPNWQTLGTAFNSPTGFLFLDSISWPRRFYRSIYP